MANDFKPSVGGRVPKAEADKWMEKYEKEMRKDKDKDTISVFFGRDVLLEILSKDGCSGISFFFCLKENDAVKKETLNLVMIGRKEDGSLMGEEDATTKLMSESTYDGGGTCPPNCK